jgi:hypothetical protein
MPDETALAASAQVVLPTHVRRRLQRVGDGARIQILRGQLSIATFEADGRGTVMNVRSIVATDTARRGDGIYTIVVDDEPEEVQWDTAEVDDAVRGREASAAMAYGRAMESVAFRLIDKTLESIDQQQKAADRREKIAAEHAEMFTVALKRLAKAIESTGKHDSKVRKLEIEAEQEADRIDAAVNILGPIFRPKGSDDDDDDDKPAAPATSREESKPPTRTARMLFALLDAKQRASVLKTEPGRTLMKATDETAARDAVRKVMELGRAGGVVSEDVAKLVEGVLALLG